MERLNKIKLGDILRVTRGASLKGENFATEGKFIRLTLGNFDYSKGEFKENTSKDNIYYNGIFNKDFILKKGDLITPLTEQTYGLLGEVATIPEDNKYIQSGDIGLINVKDTAADKRYVKYLISSPLIKNQLSKRAQQTKIRHTSPSKIENCVAYIPELKTQKSIAKTFDVISSKIDLNNKLIKKLEDMMQYIYDYWFVQFDFPNEKGKPYKSSGGKMVYNEELKREIPEGWEVVFYKNAIDSITTGLNPRKNFTLGNGDIKYVTVKNLTSSGSIDFSDCDCIDESARKLVHNRSQINKDDILFASIAPLGRCAIVLEEPKDWDINESVFCIKLNKESVSTIYLYMNLMDKSFIKKAEQNSTGSVFKGIRIATLENMQLLLPPKTTIEKFTIKVQAIIDKKFYIEKNNSLLLNLRKYLLPLLMNSQVKVKV